METSHENSRFRSQLLEKTSVLKSALLARLKSQFLPSATATVATFATVLNHSKVRYLKSGVKLSHLTFTSHLLRNDKVQKANNGTITVRISVTALLVSLLATCQPSYANNVKVQQRVNEKNTKFSLRLNSKSEDSSQLEKINQLPVFDSFNCIDAVAVNGNNKILSKSNSVTPQRHCGFFAPVICLASQAGYTDGVSAAASQLRLQSVYDGMTPQNKAVMLNMWGGSIRPRVNPVTHLASQAKSVNTQKRIGVAHHG